MHECITQDSKATPPLPVQQIGDDLAAVSAMTPGFLAPNFVTACLSMSIYRRRLSGSIMASAQRASEVYN